MYILVYLVSVFFIYSIAGKRASAVIPPPQDQTTGDPRFAFASNVTQLDLRHNGLSNISKSDFIHLPKLLRLDLSFNSLETISNDTFSKLEELVFLDLSNNVLRVLQPQAFRGLAALQELRWTTTT